MPSQDTQIELKRLLLQSDGLPHPTAQVECIETHISLVFLADRHVYKFKKPVVFPFLDYGSLAARKRACEEEVRLNSRLAPETYLGVMQLSRFADGTLGWSDRGTPVDYCVVMRRLPDESMLDRLIREGRGTRDHIDQILDVLIPFYDHAPRNPDVERHATPEAIEGSVRENFTTIEGTRTDVTEAVLRRVRSSQLQFLKFARDVFLDRIESGRIREGHGDLRPEHFCMLNPPVVFDCVEFSLPFRAADVISELAFLATECELLGASELSMQLIASYRDRTRDSVSDALVGFYKSYRACVRAKVELLRADQLNETAGESARRRAERYLQFASFSATEFYRPRLFVMVGAAGTGKSTLARALAESLGLEILSTDAIRHELAGHREPDAEYNQGIYSGAMSERTYTAAFERAARLLKEAASVVLDGSFRDAVQRNRAVGLAHEHGAELHFVLCRCAPELAEQRIRSRRAGGASESDARASMHRRQQHELDAADWSALPVIAIDTGGDRAMLVNEVVSRVMNSRERPR